MPEETEKYIRIPTGNSCTVTATITISSSKGIKALYCGKIKKIRTYLFLKSKDWTMVKAKEWVKNHKSSLEERKLIMDTQIDTPNKFKISLPITKTRIRLAQDEKGNEIEEKFVTGAASSTDVDLRGDSMTPKCLKIMADSLKQHILHLNAEHDTSWQSELGSLETLKVNSRNQLIMEAKLNRMSKSKDLWYALTELHKKLGLSIGGYVKEYEMVKDGKGEDESWRRVFKNIELDHIAVTSSPANPKTWVDVIAKSLDPEKEKLMKETINKTVDEKKTFSYLIENSKTVDIKKYAKETFKDSKQEDLLKFINETFDELDESQLLKMIERSFSMAKEKVTKKEESEVKKEDITKEVKKEEKKIVKEETEVKKEDKKEPAKVKKEDETKKDVKEEKACGDEKEDDEKDTKVKKEDNSDEKVKKDEESAKVKKEENSDETKEEVKKSENNLLKAVTGVADGLKALTKANEVLVERLEKLEKQPAGRKVAIEKTIGGEDGDKVENSEKAMDKKIAELKSDYPNDPYLFSKIQRIRDEYK